MAARNWLRGLVAQKGEGSFGGRIDRIGDRYNRADALASETFISEMQRQGELTASLPTPPQPPAVNNLSYPDSMKAATFREVFSERTHHNEARIVDFIGTTHDLDVAFARGDASLIVHLIKKLGRDFGYSIHLTQRLLSLTHLMPTATDLVVSVRDYTSAFEITKRSIFYVALEDSFDRTRDYLETRRTFVRLARSGRFSNPSRHIIEHHFSPYLTDSDRYWSRAKAFSAYSVIDGAMFALFTSQPEITPNTPQKPKDLRSALGSRIISASQYSPTEGLADAITFSVNTEDEQSGFLYKHSAAWRSDPTIRAFQDAIEQTAGRRFDGDFSIPMVRSALSKSISDDDLRELLTQPSFVPRNDLREELQIGTGRLLQTLLYLEAAERELDFKEIDGDGLLNLLSQTEDVALLTSPLEFSLLLPNREDDKLYELLRATLVYDAGENISTEYDRRAVFEEIVSAEYDGDILGLLQYLYHRSPHVGRYYISTCSDHFLTQLYQLYQSVEAVTAARERILFWYGTHTGDEVLLERARSLALENKLSRLRNDHDANRLYVDAIRLNHWLQENLAAELREIAYQGVDELRAAATLEEATDEVALMRDPSLRLGGLINRAFFEFCSNKSYGLDSYVGRRIRHGTFYGTLTSDVRTTINSFIQKQQLLYPELCLFFKSWLVQYEADIRRFAIEQLQLRSPEKPKGLIIANVNNAEKLLALAMAVDDVKSTLQSAASVPVALDVIHQHCWRLADIDLLSIQFELERLRSERMFIDGRRLPLTGNTFIDDEARSLVRWLNEHFIEKISQITMWFSKPSEVTPSATLEELFNVVVTEAREQVDGFDPQLRLSETTHIRIIGHRYQYVYDALNFVVHNAASHGKRDGELSLQTSVSKSDTHTFIEVEIFSELPTDASPEETRESLLGFMEAPLTDAMVTEGKSGIRKLRLLAASKQEIDSVRASVSDTHVMVGFRVVLVSM